MSVMSGWVTARSGVEGIVGQSTPAFLSFPLERHFEQCIHVRNRPHNYCADCAVRFKELTADELAQRALRVMQEPVAYRAVETDGAARAAKEVVSVMENRAWGQRLRRGAFA